MRNRRPKRSRLNQLRRLAEVKPQYFGYQLQLELAKEQAYAESEAEPVSDSQPARRHPQAPQEAQPIRFGTVVTPADSGEEDTV